MLHKEIDCKIMANANRTGDHDLYIYKLPYNVIKELSRILDRDNKWEELGGRYMNFDMTTIDELRRCVCRDESPTQRLLSLWGIQNHTVSRLFVLLSKMHHYQAMVVLKPLVPPEFHALIFEGERIQILQNRGDKNGGDGTQAQIAKSSSAVTALLDKNMEIGSVNINDPKSGHNTTPDKVVLPMKKLVERKINNTPENIVSNDYNNAVMSNAGAALPNPVPAGEDMVPHQVESKENNCPQRKMSNASDASSVAEFCMTIPQVAYNELMQATDNWSKANILGKGGFGTVFKGNWKNTLVAIKRIEQRGAESAESYQTQIQQSLAELRILNACRHDNILPVYGFSVGGAEPCLLYQYMPNGSLEDRLMCRNRTNPLTWLQRFKIAVGTARGLQFLHTNERPFIHGDIKSANILLDKNFEPRIGDFGLARDGPHTHTHLYVSRVQGTLPYLPEEFLRSKMLSAKVDTFSFGIVLFELGTGLRAYDETRSKKLLKDHVESCQEQHLDVLRDTKAGYSDAEIFAHLITLGKWCVSQRTWRPKMEEVLKKLENASSLRRSPLYPLQVTTACPSTQCPAVSPVPFRAPLSVSPECNSHGNVGVNMGYVSPVYQVQQHAQLSPNLHPAVQHNNPFLYVNAQRRKEEHSTTPVAISRDNRLQQNPAAVNIDGVGVSTGSNFRCGHESSQEHPSFRPVMPSISANAPYYLNLPLACEKNATAAASINERLLPQPVIAISPPLDHRNSKSLNNVNISQPSLVKSGSTNSSESSSYFKSEREVMPDHPHLRREDLQPQTASPCTDVTSVIPLITELGLTEPTITAQSKKLPI